MCTWFYADYHSLSFFIEKAQQLPLADEMMRLLGKNMAMSGNIRPTDTAAVLAPNKQGNMAVFPMVWGFTHEATPKPIINCRIETADRSSVTVFGSDLKMHESGIGKVYCRYFCKSSLMKPDQDGYLRVPMYPECPTLAEKVKKHLKVGK